MLAWPELVSARRLLAALLFLVAGVLLAGALTGAFQNIFRRHALSRCRTQGQDGSDHNGEHDQNDDYCRKHIELKPKQVVFLIQPG